ncbi:MAG TPA: Rieske (2Fe-2S) protein [Methylomirabilota bacterium]|nr:Rieske (2Fe-2S) protein [Methylomirabilota bacterium]
MPEHRVASLSELVPGRPIGMDVDGARLVLARVGETVYACGDTCTHRGGFLSEGRLSGPRLSCPLHGWTYDVRTGQCVLPTRGGSVPVYSVRIDGDSVFVEIP